MDTHRMQLDKLQRVEGMRDLHEDGEQLEYQNKHKRCRSEEQSSETVFTRQHQVVNNSNGYKDLPS